MKKNKEWYHERFLKQQAERKIRKETGHTRKLMANMCRIVGHDYAVTEDSNGYTTGFILYYYPPSFKCNRCGYVERSYTTYTYVSTETSTSPISWSTTSTI